MGPYLWPLTSHSDLIQTEARLLTAEWQLDTFRPRYCLEFDIWIFKSCMGLLIIMGIFIVLVCCLLMAVLQVSGAAWSEFSTSLLLLIGLSANLHASD